MSARIYVDLAALHPVIGDTWHRASFKKVPAPGEQIRMLCGAYGDATYDDLAERKTRPGLRQCEQCSAIYRERNHIAPIQRPVPRAR